MGRPRTPRDKVKRRNLGLRVTQAQYDWIEGEAKRRSKEFGVRVSMSAIAAKLLTEAMNRAQG